MKRAAVPSILVAVVLVAVAVIAEAQSAAKIPRIGFVSANGDPSNPGPNVEAFRQAMRDLGYVEGKNIQVEYRYIEGKSERIATLVTGLIQLKVDVLVTAALSATRVAKKETKTIPIVINVPDDPVALGLVDNLARPGGNITGLARLGRELSGKRLELLTEAVPGIKRVGILYSSTGVGGPGTRRNFEDYEVPARALKITAQSITVRNPSQDLDGAFREAIRGRANAVIIINTTPVFPFRKKITDLAIKNRLPLLAEASNWVDDGGLMSYGANDAESYRRLATYVDKILKGAKPADLPVEQPTKFELVINLKTAKEIGLTIPPNVLARADKVIK
jgi:putative tryptophan/tyrosine transport system substrate-binding protein